MRNCRHLDEVTVELSPPSQTAPAAVVCEDCRLAIIAALNGQNQVISTSYRNAAGEEHKYDSTESQTRTAIWAKARRIIEDLSGAVG